MAVLQQSQNVNDNCPMTGQLSKIQNQEERMRGLYSSKNRNQTQNFYGNCEDGI